MNKRLKFVGFIFIYMLIVFWLTLIVCNKYQNVAGYQLGETWDTINIIVMFLIGLFPAFFLPIFGSLASSVLLFIVYLFHVVPSILLIPLFIDGYNFEKIIWALFIALSYSTVCIIKRGIILKMVKVYINHAVISISLSMIGLLLAFVIIKGIGINFSIPAFDEIYHVRKDFTSKNSLLASYAVTWGGFFVIPFLFLTAFKYRGFLGFFSIVVGLTLVFVIFSSTGIKSIALAPFLCLFVFILSQRQVNFNSFFIRFLILFNVLSIFLLKVFGVDIVVYHLLRRVQIAPGMNTTKYFDYFILKGNEASVNASKIISSYYYGTDGSAPAGLFGGAIGRYGFVDGLFINLFLFLVVLIVIDIVAKKVDRRIVVPQMVLVGYALSNTSLPTVLVSYGLVFTMFFMYLLSDRVKHTKHADIALPS